MNENLIRPAFTTKRTEEERAKDTTEVFTIRLNKEERAILDQAKVILQQEKDTTALKQLARIGYEFVLQDRKTALILDLVLNNKRRNQRTGIIETEIKFKDYLANVTQNGGGNVIQTEAYPPLSENDIKKD